MKTLLLHLCLLAPLLLSTSSTHAKAVKLVTFAYPPYEYATGNGADGIVVRIVERAFDHLGEDLVIHVLPWKRALHMVRIGQADGIFTAYRTKDRLRFLDYSRVVLMPQVLSVWALRTADIAYDGSLDSLGDNSIGLVDDISYGAKVDEAIRTGRLRLLDYAPVSAQNVKKLLHGRTDAIIMNKYGAIHHLLKHNGLNRVVELTPAVSSEPSYLAFSKVSGLTALRDRLDKVLEEMIATGEYQAIIDGYFAERNAGASLQALVEANKAPALR